MGYQIEPRKVAGVVVELNRAIEGKNFNHGEVVLGISELLGRVIVEASVTRIQAQELVKVAMEHLDRTITAGAGNRDKQIITEF